MSYFNKIISATLPIFPPFVIKPFAMRYVAGETVEKVIDTVKELNDNGFLSTLDILGEHVNTREESYDIRDAYCSLYNRLANEELNCTISLKLTHIGLEIDQNLARDNLFTILETARECEKSLTIDMENSPYTDITLKLYKEAMEQYKQVGTVLQAYLNRSINDLNMLMSPHLKLRICKGIYREVPEIAYQNRDDIRDNFIKLVKTLLEGQGYAEIATHDIFLIDTLETWIKNKRIALDRFEFQVLYGVPMGNRLKQLLEKGYKVRIYVPFGEEWYPYSVRRLKENPNLAGYIFKNLFRKSS